jgi:hypothetical protein
MLAQSFQLDFLSFTRGKRMTTSSAHPDDNDVRYERIDDLTVNMYIEGLGDTTVRPSHPAVQQALQRDHEQIAQLIARTKCEQEKLNAGTCPPSGQDEPIRG